MTLWSTQEVENHSGGETFNKFQIKSLELGEEQQ